MPVSLPLDEMTAQEKISAMELLWRDLSQNSEAYDSPLWHKEVLECRESEGSDFSDWHEAKQEIRSRICK